MFCGCFNKLGGSPGFEPDTEDFDRARQAFDLLSRFVENGLGIEDVAQTRILLAECYVR